MDWPLIFLAFLGMLSGLSAAYLGVGGSVLIIPLLPALSGLSPLESVQLSLTLIFLISLINSAFFISQGLVLWPWVLPIAATGLSLSFTASFFVARLSPGGIRFLLWMFLAMILALPLILKKSAFLKSKGIYVFGPLMGLCSGLTGLGGGMVISPYLHESSRIPLKNISAVVCLSMLFVSLSAGLGLMLAASPPQMSAAGPAGAGNFLLSSSPHWRLCLFLLLGASVLGLMIGYGANARCKSPRRRRLILRSAIALMLLKVTLEIL